MGSYCLIRFIELGKRCPIGVLEFHSWRNEQAFSLIEGKGIGIVPIWKLLDKPWALALLRRFFASLLPCLLRYCLTSLTRYFPASLLPFVRAFLLPCLCFPASLLRCFLAHLLSCVPASALPCFSAVRLPDFLLRRFLA